MQRYTQAFMWTVAAFGAAAVAVSGYDLPIETLDASFMMLAALLTVSSRIVIKIARINGHTTLSDTFVFLTLLLYGGEAAVMLAALEACVSAWSMTKRWDTYCFNTAVMACSTFVTALTLQFCFNSVTGLYHTKDISQFVVALSVMALVFYLVNTILIAIAVAFKNDQPVWQTWTRHYLWTSLTYFGGAAAAGLTARLIHTFGFYAVVTTTPIITIIYFTYRMYLKNVEVAAAHAAQAELHAETLQQHAVELRHSEERFRSAFDYAAIGMALVAPTGEWLQVNHSLCSIVGYSELELLSSRFQVITHPEDLGTALDKTFKLLEGVAPVYLMETRFTHKLGHEVWVALSASLASDTATQTPHFIFQIQDITDRKRAETQLHHKAFYDVLTGLPNRARFMSDLQMAVERHVLIKDSPKRLFAALFLDLDRFKIINDSLGHLAGDQMLTETARRLELCVRPGDVVARLGGDEFTILLEDLADINDAVQVAERIKIELARPFDICGQDVFTSASVGIAPSTIGYTQAPDILRDADAAMYRAKANGKSQHALFDKTMHAQATMLLHLETDLRRAVERREFVVHYQPIVSLKTGEITGFEALARWQHPERGIITSKDFIHVAEETGLIDAIDELVLMEACRQMQTWHEQLKDDSLSISVNISSKRFMHVNFSKTVETALCLTNLNPQKLNLEITESAVMQNIEAAANIFKQLRALGVSLSLDDFGTGYSSLSYLHRFPLSTLKIDRSFVSNIADHSENKEIVRTIIMLARNLGMSVVAEGVESVTQLNQLLALDCDYAQGYLFARPVDAKAATEVLLKSQPYIVGTSSDTAESFTKFTWAQDADASIDWSQVEVVS